jgi:2-oxoisovalerate ferredoxin oxidoreductase beta subunit
MADFAVVHEKAHAFYPVYERKSDLQHQTHYCPGCGHGIVHKLLARAIDELRIQDRAILVSPVGCSVFAYYYFDVGNIQAAHGRAAAVATAVKRSRPDSIVLSYQGDGDLAAIGSAEILHAANRGEPITVVFVNNGIYGMTGGQLAPTTPLGLKSTTSPFGRTASNEGFPLHVCELLASLEAPVFLERVALGSNKQIMHAAKVLRKALENQVRGLGFSLVEVLSPCPTIWKLDPLEAQRFVRETMAATFPIANFRDRHVAPASAPVPTASAGPQAGIARPEVGEDEKAEAPPHHYDLRIRIAGAGGQGVLMLGEVLADAGIDDGYEVSWLPSYGPEMRSGTSNCHVRLSPSPIDSPLVSRPNVLIAMNELSLRKFLPDVQPGGLAIFNGAERPAGCERPDVRLMCLPATQLADGLGSPKAGNIVMLGALLGMVGALSTGHVIAALRRTVKSQKWFELDVAALDCGSQAVRQGVPS